MILLLKIISLIFGRRQVGKRLKLMDKVRLIVIAQSKAAGVLSHWRAYSPGSARSSEHMLIAFLWACEPFP
jgi:hypothetical protein